MAYQRPFVPMVYWMALFADFHFELGQLERPPEIWIPLLDSKLVAAVVVAVAATSIGSSFAVVTAAAVGDGGSCLVVEQQ